MMWFWDSRKQRNTYWTVFAVLSLIVMIAGEDDVLPAVLVVIWFIFGQLILRKLEEKEKK